MKLIKNNTIKHIFWFCLTASLLAILICNYLIYPFFADMQRNNTEAQAVRLGRHISRLIFPADTTGRIALDHAARKEIDHVLDEFELLRLKIYNIDGKVIYSTDRQEMQDLNAEDSFEKVVARGFAGVRTITEDQVVDGGKVRSDIIETTIPIMRNGYFAGALGVHLDVTDKANILRNALLIFNLISISFVGLFSIMILIVLKQLDQAFAEREKNALVLEKTCERLNREIDIRNKIHMEREKLIKKLQVSLGKVKKLSGYLPICSCCKKIRDKQGYWKQVEIYIREHSEAEFSHSMCPDCVNEHYGQFLKLSN